MPNRGVCIGLLALFVIFGAGCGAGGGAAPGPPDGWDGAATRWWRAGVDTAGLFRDLETMEAMGVRAPERVFASNRSLAMQSEVGREQVVRAVKRSLIRLYRNDPVVVDSLFDRFVTPKIQEADLSGDMSEAVARFKKQGYELITNVYREPRAVQQPQQITYPDSLRRRDVTGAVRTQVYVDAEGRPVAVELVEGIHPVLNRIAMEATTQMQWQPAYLMRKGNWKPLPAWVRYTINFRTPE